MDCSQYLKNKYLTTEINKRHQKEVNTWKWLVLVGCFLLQMIPYCITLNLNNVFVGSDWNTWVEGNNVYIGIAFTLGSIISAILSPIVAKFFNKQINYKFVYSMGIITALIGFMGPGIIAIITKQNQAIPSLGVVIPILWTSVILAQLGAMIFSGIGINNLISRWWPANKRGFALGIAFAGGSLGMIWLKQLLSFLSNNFGNITPTKTIQYPLDGNQYATYFILGGIGIFFGIMIVLLFCKKPLPPMITDMSKTKVSNQQAIPNDDVSPLETRKYPFYWMIGIGYLFIQMGTIHASMNGLIIANTTVIANKGLNYNDIMGIGGSIFGVCCIIGNVFSGYLNDKFKPSRSIFFAGIIQCLAIFCLMYSTINPSFVYVYFICAGISVYIYTTMPAYISGRLYGPTYSNNHMAILSIFLAIGFAIINSLSGFITGPTGLNANYEIRNPQTLFGITVAGNFLALELFALISMLLGTIITAICCSFIRQKTTKGIKEYNPNKFLYIITFRYGLSIKFWAWLSLITKRNINSFKHHNKELTRKENRDKYHNVYEKFELSTISYLETKYPHLTKNEMCILSNIYFYGIVNKKWIEEHEKKRLKFDTSIEHLLNLNLVRIKKDNENKIYYALNKKLNIDLDQYNNELKKQYPKVNREITNLRTKINKLKIKYGTKIRQLQSELLEIDEKYNNHQNNKKLLNKTEKRINYLNKNRDKWLNKTKDLFDQYVIDYEYAQKICVQERKKKHLIHAKERAIKLINRKIDKYIFLETLYKFQQIHGHCLYLEFIDNHIVIYQRMIINRIANKIQMKLTSYSTNMKKQEKKLEALKNIQF